jgi:alpha-galactosidase
MRLQMLEVGIRLPDGVGLTHVESRVHFAMWAVTSSPLILGFDLTDDAAVDSVWDIVANEEVLAISQQWAGHPGRLVRNATSSFDALTKHGCSDRRGDNQSMPEYQVWAKPQPNRTVALLVVNICDAEHCADATKLSLDLTIPLSEIYIAPWEADDMTLAAVVPNAVRVRDVWGHSEQGVARGSVRVKGVGGHDGVFLLLTPTDTSTSEKWH